MSPRTSPADEDARWQPWFYLGIAVLALSILTSVALFTNAACGSGSSVPLVPAGTPATADAQSTTPASATKPPDPSATAASNTPDPATSTATAATAAPTSARPTETEDPSLLVGCGLLSPVDQDRRVSRDCVVGPLVNVEGFSLNADAASAWESMKADASAEGIDIFIISAYRSYDVQKQLYDQEVAAFGPDQNTSAKPGHSEHQLGTTIDINELSGSFGDTPAGIWLQQNAPRYGFVMSYPPGREGQTGYAYEPWHWRYVGPGTASSYLGSGLTLNRFLGP
ncbi:MAG: D-alanyl-D-alanine carboxypeptidase family protein [Dehalococcoidia bacterium]